MKAKIEINMDNDAFVDNPASELGRILAELTQSLRSSSSSGILMGVPLDTYGGDRITLKDINGNSVGDFELIPSGEEKK